MIKLEDVMGLASFKERSSYVTSFYLGFGTGDHSKKFLISANNLIKRGGGMIEDLAPGNSDVDSLNRDLELIEHFMKNEFERKARGGLALFSSSSSGFFRSFYLQTPILDRIVMKRSFYIRPLTLILDDFKRCIVVLVDRTKARVFEAHLGEMLTYTEITSDVPGHVREGGYEGYEEKKISRHIEAQAQRHYKKVARQLLDLFKTNRFERLILGGTPDVVGEFEKALHTYLKDRVIGHFAIESDAPIIEVFEKSRDLAERLERRSEEELVNRLLDDYWPQGRGTAGVEGTIEALMKGEVYALLVSVGFVRPGFSCRACGYLSTTETTCSLCESVMEPVTDIVDEMVSEAVRQRSLVHHISGTHRLQDQGGVGSILRFRV